MLFCWTRRRFNFRFYGMVSLVCVCILLVYSYSWYWSNFSWSITKSSEVSTSIKTRHLSKLLTVVLRQFEDLENDVAESVQSFVSAFPNMPVLVVCTTALYPPLPFTSNNESLRNVRVISLDMKLTASPQELDPLTHILTEYVLFVPDSTRVSRRVLQQAMTLATANPTNAIVIGVGSARPICQKVKWSYVNWTLQYNKDTNGIICDAVRGQHSLLIQTSVLRQLPEPFRLPFPETLYLQTAVRKIKIRLADSRMAAGKSVFKTVLAKQRAAHSQSEHRLALYKQLGVKALVREDKLVQWFGCRKDTARCFPAVQRVPSYIHSGRNTPPCCRRNIRRTVRHVLKVLQEAGARCWLETTSLLGAIMRNDLIPWAEYAEVGIHAGDVSRVAWLSRGGVDSEGFVWEQATKGRYYRVAYSTMNRVYTLILPFSARNQTMWPDDWVLAQQRDFPEKHLHPLAQIKFAGLDAPSPNDARAFLDHKLGLYSVERALTLGPKILYP